MEMLSIVPVWNVPYRFEFNVAIERYWGQLKAWFRPLLLKKMLVDFPRKGATPLKDALFEAVRTMPTNAIPSYVERSLRNLRDEANEIR